MLQMVSNFKRKDIHLHTYRDSQMLAPNLSVGLTP